MGKTLLLTGHPRSGKTTIVRKVIEVWGDRAGGFYTEEIAGPGGRKGFRLITLDGGQYTLAHKDFRGPRVPRVGRYGVDPEALAKGVEAIRRAMREGKLVVVDEIGKMELLSPDFRAVVLQAILGPTPVFGTILFKPHPHADLYKTLAQVTLWEVDPRTRDALPRKVLAFFEEVNDA